VVRFDLVPLYTDDYIVSKHAQSLGTPAWHNLAHNGSLVLQLAQNHPE